MFYIIQILHKILNKKRLKVKLEPNPEGNNDNPQTPKSR